MPNATKHSSQRIAQSVWFVVSVYFGLLLGDIVQNGIYPALFEESEKRNFLVLMVCSLVFFLISVVESFIWLNPPKDTEVSGKEAIFRLLQLSIYVASVLCMAFLTLSLTREATIESARTSTWLSAFVMVLFLYAASNLIWVIKAGLAPFEGNPTRLAAIKYASFYLAFAFIFLGIRTFFVSRHQAVVPYVSAAVFVAYVIAYFSLWWDSWHSKAFISSETDPYEKIPADIRRDDSR